jgi:hypothetical protein
VDTPIAGYAAWRWSCIARIVRRVATREDLGFVTDAVGQLELDLAAWPLTRLSVVAARRHLEPCGARTSIYRITRRHDCLPQRTSSRSAYFRTDGVDHATYGG